MLKLTALSQAADTKSTQNISFLDLRLRQPYPVAYPVILFVGAGSTNSAEDRERGPLVRGSGDSCNLVFREGGLNPPNHPLGTPLAISLSFR
jgi:hypothetical protein